MIVRKLRDKFFKVSLHFASLFFHLLNFMFALSFFLSDLFKFFGNDWRVIPFVLMFGFLLILLLIGSFWLVIFKGANSVLENFKILLDFAFKIIFFLFILSIKFISLIEVLSRSLSGDHDIVVNVLLGKDIFGS